MTPVGRFVTKTAAFLGLVVAVQVGMYFFKGGDNGFYVADVKEYLAVIAGKPDVIYFGDSVATNYNSEDQNRGTMRDMIAAARPGMKIGSIDHAAYNLAIFDSIFRNMITRGFRPKVAIVHVNMRSFSIGWYKNPDWQFKTLRLTLDHDHLLFRAFFTPLGILGAFNLNPISQAEFRGMAVWDGDALAGSVRQFEARDREDHEHAMGNNLVYKYMYRLTPDHELVRAAASIAREGQRHGVRVLFCVTPIDVETGRKYLGERMVERLRQNIAVIKNAVEPEGAGVLDLSESAPSQWFDWRKDNTPNEHLNETGKRFVAGRLALDVPIQDRR